MANTLVELEMEQDYDRQNELEERIISLREARDLTIEQMQKEEVREQREDDISRLQRFKKRAKENMVGLSALAVSIADIVTTITVSARKAILRGSQATGKFAKALYNLGKKLGSLLGSILNILTQAISLGAKGLA